MKWIVLKRSIFTMAMAIAVIGCDENKLEPLERNLTAPGQVQNVIVENLPGKAKITYTLPSEQDLLYVKAEYTLSSGQKMEVKASYYNNALMVEGFGDTEEHVVKLYSVNRSAAASQAVLVTIKPLEAPIFDVFRSLKVKAAFGGVFVEALNGLRTDVSILVMEKNQEGDWVVNTKSIYTSTKDIAKTIRGLDVKQHDLAITIRDRWLNTTDTLYTSITPYLELSLPKTAYTGYFPGDTPRHASTPAAGMWDGDLLNWPKCYLTQGGLPGQHSVTIDTGVLAKMSRIVIWDYPEYYLGRSYYYIGNLKEFEVWGSDTPPAADGSLTGWHLLGRYNAIKPSGLPYGQQTNEDYQTANAGLSWEFDVDAPKVRYLKIKSLKNWAGIGSMSIAEIQVYGNPN
jgi:hypothetical protein